MNLAPLAAIAASVGLRHLMDQWGVWPASPTPLTRFIGLAPLRRMHARPKHKLHRFAALKRATVGSQVSLRSIISEFRDGMVRSGAKKPRDTLFKGCNIQESSVGDTSVGYRLTLHQLKGGKEIPRFFIPF